MKSLTDQEYLDLLRKLVNEQYDDAIQDYDIENMEWAPADPPAKEMIPEPAIWGCIDLTSTKSSDIAKELGRCTNFKIGNFKIRITRIMDLPNGKTAVKTASLEIWEEKDRTPNGMPCKIDFPTAIAKDKRFAGRPWLKYFHGSGADHVPMDTIVDIVRWMQALKKLSAFL